MEVLHQALKITEFQITEVLPFDYEQEVEATKIKIKQITNKIADTEGLIKVTEDQLMNGIENINEDTNNGNNKTKN